jgi:3-deoxy-D-manno-octulosonate cytidylyltransferase
MVHLVVSDADGVLTDGRINIGEEGELYKSFDVKDGLGIVRWMESGGAFAIVTSRTSNAVRHRAEELDIETVRQGVADKVGAVEAIADEHGVSLSEVAYIGDDDSDAPVLHHVGVGAAPADASPAARLAADYVCSRDGGDRAVREFLEHLRGESSEALGVIPARYGSTRFPGKPLADIAGDPMIQHVYERASEASELDRIVVATDDERIVDTVEAVGGTAVMTDPEHRTGTDRVAEVARRFDHDIIVNIQGDEPLIDPDVIDATVTALRANEPQMATPISLISNEEALDSRNTVKVVVAEDGRALYFSRSRIPSGGEIGSAFKHIGLYAFETELLLSYVEMESELEEQEDLEQLRLLENGFGIQTIEVDYDAREVNVEGDIKAVEERMRE